MSNTFISHVGDVLEYVKEYWQVLTGTLLFLYGAALMVKRNWLRGYATKNDMDMCRKNLILKINENAKEIQRNREVNTHEHAEILSTIIRHLNK